MLDKIIALLVGIMAFTSTAQADVHFLAFTTLNVGVHDYLYSKDNVFPGIAVDPKKERFIPLIGTGLYDPSIKDNRFTLTVHNGHGWCAQQSNYEAMLRVPMRCNAKIAYRMNGKMVHEDIPDVCIYQVFEGTMVTGTILKVDDKGDEIDVDIMQAEEYDHTDDCIKGFTYNFKEGKLTTR